jgi:signal peptidase
LNKKSKALNKKVKASIRISVLILVALIIGVNVYSLNATRLTGNSVPMPFGVGVAVVLSGSMEPELSVGDLLIITEQESYSLDDIVVYQDAGMAITHRIVSVTEDEVITRGDANNTDDAPITREQIKGEVVFAIPFVGYLVNVIKTPLGTLCILVLAIFLLERSFHAKKEDDKKKLESIKAEIEKLKQEQNKNS